MKKIILTILVALGQLVFADGDVLAKKRLNIVFIFSDDHSFEAISAYGGRLKDVAPTPNLDRIASEGIRFDNCFVTNALCGPSRAVIQTGKHSHLNGFLENHHVFNGDQQTFPKILQKGGYQTALIGKWHLGSDPQGFDLWNVLPGQGTYYAPEFRTPAGKVEGKPGEYVTEANAAKPIGIVTTINGTPFIVVSTTATVAPNATRIPNGPSICSCHRARLNVSHQRITSRPQAAGPMMAMN